MNRSFLPLLFLGVVLLAARGQSVPPPYQIAENNAVPPADTPPAKTEDAPPAAGSARTGNGSAADRQSTIDRLTKNNQELLDLLKQQQAVLEDIQYDRRLQNRQITLVEARLEDTLQENAALQVKIAKLQAQLASAKAGAPGASGSSAATNAPPAAPAAAEVAPAPPPPPASYLPGVEPTGEPGTMWWHRLLAISGDDSKSSPVFHIAGKQWRVLWHNQDRPGAAYKNTSALFISAFPQGDTIPRKVCSQLGTGGDSTEMTGSGDYYLKVESSGGHWEAAVEDFRGDDSGK